MNFVVLHITDGREDYAERSLASAKEHLPEPQALISVDDSTHELGFAGAIARGWARIREETPDAAWVFHLEDDFTFNGTVPLDRMAAVLKRRPYLVQMSLKRQPWNEREKAAGGIVEADPDDFTQHTEVGDVWTEHRRYFTTNPSLYPAALCAQGWPQVDQSEGIFTHRLLEDPKVRFGVWGAKYDPPLVEHIGKARAGHSY